ncbi:MAG: putative DNA binding domain-containing protein [Desulfamplus sp.]|nr:putative DNA binding domain-containing protein [Desulfamplus sp.]
MNSDIQVMFQNGENSLVEFKEVTVSPESLAEEIVAFLNVKGGSIYLGVSDNGTITGIDIERKASLEQTVINICRNNISPPIIPIYETILIEEKCIARITIPEGIEKPYRTIQGKHFLRVGSTKRLSSREELLRLYQNAIVLHIDDHPISGAGTETIDLQKVKLYFQNVYEFNFDDLSKPEQYQLLINSSIIATIGKDPFATIAGLIFFSKKESLFSSIERFLPRAGIQFVAYENYEMDSILDRFESCEACPEAIDSIVHKIRINWKTPSQIQGLKREELKFPMKVFRELMVNAVVHRDYTLQSKIQVQMFPDKIRVVTPGRLVNTVTIEKMKAGTSIPRNPVIMKFMQNYRYADQLGRGIPMIIRTVQQMPGFNFIMKEEENRFISVLEQPLIS